jgi:hypothetical protein
MPIPTFLKQVGPVVSGFNTGGVGAARRNRLNARMTCQEADLWCWAAVTQTVEDFRGTTVAQSDIATAHVSIGQPGMVCRATDSSEATVGCGDPCRGACNSPHLLSKVLAERGRLVSKRPCVPVFQDVIDAIDNDKPLPVRIQINTSDGGGHFICVIGYSDDGAGNQFVDVLDPMMPGVGQGKAGIHTLPFESFVGGAYNVNGDPGTPNYIYDVQLQP